MDPTRTFSRRDVLTSAPGAQDVEASRVLPKAPEPRPDGAPRSLHVMTKPTGAICNLDCTYCFFLSKEALYPSSKFRMDDDLLEQYIRQVIESQQQQYVTIAWQGGEPTLMGLDFFRRAIELVEKHRRPGMTVEHTIQTNGTLLTPEWADFFAEHGYLVGLSMDGPPDIHDAQRVDKGGKPTHAKVLAAAQLLSEHGAEFNILCTVHAVNAERGREVYRYFRDEAGASFIQFIPIIERATPELIQVAEGGWGSHVEGRPLYTQAGSLVTGRSITDVQWGRFLVDIFEEWVRRDVGSVYVQMFDVTLANFVGEPPHLCIYSETCGAAMAMEHNGDMYSCDHFVEPDYMVGNINEQHLLQIAASPQQRKFGQDKRDRLPRFCRECDVRFACHGGCPKDRFIEDPYGEPGLNYLCGGYKTYFGHVDEPMRAMGELLRRQRAPAEIMRWYAIQDSERGRNNLCSCGSGRKFKRCHGDGPLPSVAEIEAALRPPS